VFQRARSTYQRNRRVIFNLTEEQKGKNQCFIGLIQPTGGTEGLKPVSIGLVQPTRGTEGLKPVFQLAHSTYQRNRRVKTNVPSGSFNLLEEQKG
jgi:hypothetical protein